LTKTKTGIYAVKLSKGGLTGYTSKDTREERHKSLKKLINKLKKENFTKKEAIVKLIRRLNIIAIYNKNKNPTVSKIYRKDIYWLQQM
jgi:chorismate mutase